MYRTEFSKHLKKEKNQNAQTGLRILRRFEKSVRSKHANIVIKCRFLTMEDTLDLLEHANQLTREHEFTASVTEESCEGDCVLVDQVYEYIAAGTYPTGCSQNKKKDNSEEVGKVHMGKDGELLYLEKGTYSSSSFLCPDLIPLGESGPLFFSTPTK